MDQPFNRREFVRLTGSGLAGFILAGAACGREKGGKAPNIVLIYADDLGYGDVSCYGAMSISTPNIDRLAAAGVRFTDAHATSATCTPSRYSLLTGQYAWRREDTGVATGDAAALIAPGTPSLASTLKAAGYRTAVVGKWHLGLGPKGGPDWNGTVAPGPLEIGFDYSFIIPATGDRVPCVFVEGHSVVGLDPSDPIKVSFDEPILEEPTGREHAELLRLKASAGHDNTIVNGVGRIGYMRGGKSALWVDEDIADTLTAKAVGFFEQNAQGPFFLYFSTHDIHVPRLTHQRFAGKSGLGARGDAILEFDWSVGQILDTLERLNLTDDTLVILSSDNGPVVDDGYQDQSKELLDGHKPSGPLRGGKYSAYDAGTRVPFMVRWPGHVTPGGSAAMVSQVDLFASLAALTGQAVPENGAPDSRNALPQFLGQSAGDREYVVEHAVSGALSIIQAGWKYIEPHGGAPYDPETDIELGNSPEPQLFDLSTDLAEKNNLAAQEPEKAAELAALLEKVKASARTR